MALAPQKQDANLVGFYKIREADLGVVPATGAWQTREPNSFDDLGAEYTKVARKPFSPSRQRKKGQTTDLDADGGYNEDLTQNNMQGELEEFFFAVRRKSPEQLPSAVTSTVYTVASNAGFTANTIVFAKGFAIAGNNGRKVLTASASTSLTAAGLTAEASPPAGAKVKAVGFQFAAADLVLATPTGVVTLASTAKDFRQLSLIPGQWVFVKYNVANTGYARIALNGVQQNLLTFDKTTWTPAADPGTGITAEIYFGDVLKNEDDPDLIVRFSSVMERTLGKDADGTQSEYLIGSVANEMTWNSPLAELVNIDMGYIAQKTGLRTGLEGPLVRRASNTIIRALGEEAFNTTSNVYRIRMAMIDPATLNPSPFFARVTEWSATVNNNVSSTKGQGVLGGFDTTAGNFEVDAEVTAYFSTVQAIHAVKCNWDVTFDAIYAKQNAGIFFDLPLVSLGGGRLDIEQDAAIMLPLESAAAESVFGHTAMIGWFDYLPDEAMPDIDC